MGARRALQRARPSPACAEEAERPAARGSGVRRVDRLRSRVRHYTNLSKMAGKLRKLASDFSWGRMDEIARIEAQRCVPFGS